MKKVYIFLFVILTLNLFSQSLEVDENKKAFLFKATASWCSPCGYYHGITDEIYNNHADSILFLNGHVASSSVGDAYSGDMHNLLNGAGGIPSYSLSGVHLPQWPPTIDMIMDEANVFFDSPVVANIAFDYEIIGSELSINTTTKFFQDISVDHFYVGVMVLENNIMVNQNNENGYEDILQHRIQRTVIGDLIDLGEGKKLWADEIATGDIEAGSYIDHSFTKTLNDSWDIENIELLVVIWQRIGDQFVALSCEDVPQVIDALPELEEDFEMTMYPNPVDDIVHISMIEAAQSEISIVDNLGRLVYHENSNIKQISINVSHLNEGIYYVTITNSEKTFTKSFLKQ